MSAHRRLCLLLAVCPHTFVENWANFLRLHRCVDKTREEEEFCTAVLGLESLYGVCLSVSCTASSLAGPDIPRARELQTSLQENQFSSVSFCRLSCSGGRPHTQAHMNHTDWTESILKQGHEDGRRIWWLWEESRGNLALIN